MRSFFEEILGRQAEMGVNPMECVACGAAIQAGVLTGEVGDIALVDVTPLTLGVETLGGITTALMSRNTPVPAKETETFTTATDFQTSLTVHVYQGERAMAADKVSLGEFNLDGIPPAPRGVPKIELSFGIDAKGILSVTARDIATGRSQSVRIRGSIRLAKDVKERMVREAHQFADAAKKRREEAEALNEADALCYQAEKMRADISDKLTAELKDRIEQARRETKEACGKLDVALGTDKAEALRKVLKEASVVIHAQAQPPGTGPYQEVRYDAVPPPDGSAGGEARPSRAGFRGRVVDADYR